MRSLTEIAPGVYELSTSVSNLFILAEEKVTLVDSGFFGSLPRIEKALTSLGYSLMDISQMIITHNHFDHTAAVAELQKTSNCKVAMHRADVIWEGSNVPYANIWRWFLTSPLAPSYRSRFILGREQVGQLLEGGEEFSCLGGLHVIHTPGHTCGSICLYSAKRKVLLVGDSLSKKKDRLNYARRFPSVDFEGAKKSLTKLKGLEFEAICFGHGRAIREGGSCLLAELLSGT